MIRLLCCLALATVALAQYNNQQYGAPQQQYQAPQQSYQGQQGPKKPLVLANVHYASLGPKLEGDYKYGYEAGDGAFRHETRNPDGSVTGSYGYVDGNGVRRVVKYTAGKHGFSASGDGVPNSADASGPVQALPAQRQQSYQPAPQQYQPQYQAPQQQYQAPPQQYQAPQQQYQPPPQQYQAPQPQYQPQQYQPQQSYRSNQNIVAPSDGTYNPQFNTQGHWDPNRWSAVPYSATGQPQNNHLG